MSASDRVTATLVTQLAQAADGALLGVSLAYIAGRSLIRYFSASSALDKIRHAPSVSVSDLRSVIPPPSDDSADGSGEIGGEGGGGVFVIVRGTVDAKSAVEGKWMSLRPEVLFSSNSGENAVIVRRTQSCIYHGWRSFMPWTSELRSIVGRAWREESSYTRAVPFVLKQGGQQSQSDYLVVNMEGSDHPLPLVTVFHQMQPISATPYTLLQALFGRDYPVGLLEEEKILPSGKEISAIGVCYLKGGVPEIKSCNDLPYFLSEMNKHQMVADLSFKMKVLLWTGIIIGSISLGFIGFSIKRNWVRWKEWRQQARSAREADREVEVEDEEDLGEVLEGQLCVMCLARRRLTAFVPCGHLVCCQRCARLIERETTPKCPVCRQSIRSSVRIYSS